MGIAVKILIVDDETVIRELLCEILSEDGYEIESAPNGMEALDILRSSPDFVLLFTDIMMPGMDGITLIREAKAICPTIIPIVMTAFHTFESARAAVKEGAYDYVMKPFTLNEIKLAVGKALERYHLTTENARLREITELFNISETIAAFHDENKLLNYVLRAALERVSARRGSLMVVTRDGRALRMAASIGLPDEAADTVIEVGTGITGRVARDAKALLVEDIEEEPQLMNVSRRLNNSSFISIPLERKPPPEEGRQFHTEANGRVIAVLNVTEKINGRFSERDLKILTIVANHAAAAIDSVRLLHDVQTAHISTLQSMAMLLEAKDRYTHGHSERVRDYCVLAATRLGFSTRDIETINLGAMLHDIGKIGVTDAVLNKTDKLNDDEWGQIRRHPVIGYEVLSQVPILTPEHLSLVRSHHEKVDGKGYPDGLKGDELSPLVRIIAVADSFDAMSSSRAYRQGLSIEKVRSELLRCSGTQFDPDVAQLFVDLLDAGEILRDRLTAAIPEPLFSI